MRLKADISRGVERFDYKLLQISCQKLPIFHFHSSFRHRQLKSGPEYYSASSYYWAPMKRGMGIRDLIHDCFYLSLKRLCSRLTSKSFMISGQRRIFLKAGKMLHLYICLFLIMSRDINVDIGNLLSPLKPNCVFLRIVFLSRQ
jgi:hypothetical protein